ncbi:hypothetical protein [Lewinella sp. W8]|uniref:hypothetical protein n=1 Tax=Lewinella sp. W8 TaxID=2528208 RepID=UPI001067453A|nr:hypothetical protein [Lewinella sp. W8]MTB51336.1 hypothetical protein [Lewinella sp. W8]
MPKEVSKPVTKDIKVIVRAVRETDDLDTPLYAINWFSTKRAWMYSLYLSLAVTQVKTVGAFPVFKAFVGETLEGDPQLAREQLLIVRYPHATAFLTLASKTLFQIISILRINSVKDFTFNFTEKITHEPRPENYKSRHHVVHFFTGTSEAETAYRKLADDEAVKLTYFGRMKAELMAQRGEKSPRGIPYLMNHFAVWEAADADSLKNFLAEPAFVALRATVERNYVATLDRVL